MFSLYKLKRFFHYLNCRFFNKGNVIKLRNLNYFWHDTDGLMEAAIEQLFLDCVEKERLFETTSPPESQFEDWNQLKRLYDYFKFEKKKKELEIEVLSEKAFIWNVNDDLLEFLNRKKTLEEQKLIDELMKKETEFEQEKTEKYCELVRLRGYLWA